MRRAEVFVNSISAGLFIENSKSDYDFLYNEGYLGSPISLSMQVRKKNFKFYSFPAFFEGLLPEGSQLEALLRQYKINRYDYFSQLMVCGRDCVGAITLKELV